jgi:hypothetical protein
MYSALIDRSGGVARLVNTTSSQTADPAASTWTVAITAAAGGLDVLVTGPVVTVRWVASVEIVEVIYAGSN